MSSSVLAEASILGKPVVQIRLTSYPGCFPEEDRRKQGIWISEEVLKTEEEQTDRSQSPLRQDRPADGTFLRRDADALAPRP